MANTSVDDLFGRWQKRGSSLSALPPETYKGVVQQDVKNVLKGGSPLSDQEAALHIARATTGQSLVGDPKRKTGFWGTIGNIPADIKDLAGGLTKLPEALVKEAKVSAVAASHSAGPFGGMFSDKLGKAVGTDYFSDEKKANSMAQAFGYKDAEEMRAKDPALQGDISKGDIFRLVTKAPFVRMVPGAYTAGNLTSPEGRTQLQEAPVQAGLDILPIVGKGGRLVAASKVDNPALASTIRRGGKPARAAALEAFPEVSPTGVHSPMEALASGRPIRALSRALPGLATDEMGNKLSVSDRLKNVAKAHGIDSASRDIARELSNRNRTVEQATQTGLRDIDKEFKDLGFTDEEARRRLSQTAERRTADMDIDPATKQAFDIMERETQQLLDDPLSGLERDAFGEIRSRAADKDKPILATTKKAADYAAKAKAHEDLLNNVKLGDPPNAKYPTPMVKKDGTLSERMVGEPMSEFLARTSQRGRDHRAKLAANAIDKANALTAKVEADAAKVAPARFIPVVNDNIRAALKAEADFLLDPDVAEVVKKDIDLKLDPLRTESLIDEAGDLVFDEEFPGLPRKVVSDIIKQENAKWLELRDAGLDPVFLPGMTRSRTQALGNPSIALDRTYTPSYEKGRNPLGASTVDDALVSLVGGRVEQLKRVETNKFIDWMKGSGHLIEGPELDVQLRNRVRDFAATHPEADIRAFEESLRSNSYQKFDPAELGMTFAGPGGDYYIPKHLAKTIRELGFKEPTGLGKLSNKTQGVFKKAVLFQPSFLFNNAVGNMMFALMEADGPITAIKDIRTTLKAIRSGEGIPTELKQGAIASIDMPAPAQFKFRTGGKIRQALDHSSGVDKARLIERKWFGANAALDDFYRAWAYVQDFRKTGDEAGAIRYARQVYSDMDELTPVERGLIKQVIPFYSFQRHLFKFAARYPVDHPIRTQIIATAIRQQEEEGDLPGRFKSMFWLGDPDEQGEQWRVNLRSLNPFADFGNNFTLGGFLSNASPLIKAPAEAFGISDITGAPGYTKRGYNSESGRYEAGRNFNARSAIGNFLPPFERISDFVDPEEGRYSPEREPTALKATTSILNIPLVPRVTNVDRERYLDEQARIRDVSNAIQDAQSNRGDSQLQRYDGLVPFRGQLVPAQVVAQVLAAYRQRLQEAGYTGAPSAVTPRR